MDTKKSIKGGVIEMEKVNGEIYTDKCPFCDKVFRALNKNQIQSWLQIHILNCKSNPSNKLTNETKA